MFRLAVNILMKTSLVSVVEADGLVLLHQAISSHNTAHYRRTCMISRCLRVNIYINCRFAYFDDNVLKLCIQNCSEETQIYRQISNIRRTFVGNIIVDVVGASPVGAAPTTSSFSI